MTDHPTAEEVLALAARLKERQAEYVEDHLAMPADHDALDAAKYLRSYACLLEQQSAPDEVERVALALFAVEHERIVASWGDEREEGREYWRASARAAIAAMGQSARNAALEEAARLMETEAADCDPDDLYTGRQHRAAAIRALKRSSPSAPDDAPKPLEFQSIEAAKEAAHQKTASFRRMIAAPPAPDAWEALQTLRSAGWMVAVHNDYRINGKERTFWLFTHPSGVWTKGEGDTDQEALNHAVAASPFALALAAEAEKEKP